MKAKALEELNAWQEARFLANMIYELIQRPPLNTDYALCDRMWRSSLSTMFNIAKGFESSNNEEFTTFLGNAKRSLGEIKSQLYQIFDQAYVDRKGFKDLHGQATLVGREIADLISELKESGKKKQTDG